MTRVLVCGGRDYADEHAIAVCLGGLLPRPTLIIQGGNKGVWRNGKRLPGADLLAKRWAEANGIAGEEYAVDHALDGEWPGAGPRRNQRMLVKSSPEVGIVFPGNKGTADMMRRLKAEGIPVIEVK